MKKTLLLSLIIFSMIMMFSCASAKTLTCTEDELLDKLKTANEATEGEMYALNAKSLAEDYLIDSSLYTSGKLLLCVESAGVEAIAFFTANDPQSAETIKNAFTTYVNRVKTEQENYSAENYKTACDALVKVEGNYVYLIMSKNKDSLIKIVDEYLK